MPAAEDLAESEPEPPSAPAYPRERGRDRPPEPPRPGFEDAVWFKLHEPWEQEFWFDI